jgi:hypothetical protein
VIITVRSESGTPLVEAEVRTGPRLTVTDKQGLARLSLPAGQHLLNYHVSFTAEQVAMGEASYNFEPLPPDFPPDTAFELPGVSVF